MLLALHAGSVYDINNGYYNLIDPTGYLFPESNGSSRFERIPVSEKAQFLDFINRRQPNWKIPRREQVLNLDIFNHPRSHNRYFIGLSSQEMAPISKTSCHGLAKAFLTYFQIVFLTD